MNRCFIIILCLLVLTCAAAAEVRFTSDITRLGVGARPLGMGKMFTGLADDISAMYLNPAGLGSLKNPEFLTMSGKFVNQVNYLTFAAALPTKFGTVGIGYSGAALGFSTPALNLVEIATGEYRVIPSTTESVSYDYNNYALALAYATPLFRPDLSFGATLKFFNEKISGSTSGSAAGQDLDLGVLFKPNPSLSLGVLAKNVLPANLGGKIKWADTNLEESVPLSLNLGGSFKLNLARLGNVIIGSDYEMKPTQENIPGLYHTGLEWWPTKLLALRVGVDQDVIGKESGTGLEVTSNQTAGVSLNFADFRFDYAYHRYNNIAANDTNYLSIVYTPQPIKIIPLAITEPNDRLITTRDKITVRGKVQEPKIKVVKINGETIALSKKGSFETEVALPTGKNAVWIAGFDAGGKKIAHVRLRILKLMGFRDISEDYWAADPIEQLATLGIMTGYPGGAFKPEEKIDRAHLLINLLQIDGGISSKSRKLPFTDVKSAEWITPYIQIAYDAKLAQGYPDRTFRPWRLSSRLEGAIMTVRASRFTLAEVLERPYEDISARHWAIKDITAAKEKGMLNFVINNFYPQKEITRAEFAIMLSKTPKVSLKINELLDFETGYQAEYPY